MLANLIHKLKAVVSNPLILQGFKTMVLRVIGMVTLYGFTVFITNTYPAAVVGQYDFIRTFLLVTGTFCLLGTEQSVLYFAGNLRSSNTTGQLRSIYKKMIGITALSSFALLALLVIIGSRRITYFLEDKTIYPLMVKAAAVLFFNGLTLLNTEVFRALGYNSVSEIFRNTVKYIPVIAGSILLVYLGKEDYLPSFYVFGFVLLGTITTGMAFYFFSRQDQVHVPASMPARAIVKTSFPMAISGMAIFLLMSIDILLLKKYMGNAYVAYYGVAVKLMTVISLVILTVNITLSTRISELYSSRHIDELKKVVSNGSKLTFIITTPITLLVCIFPETILHIFGPAYIQAKYALIIMMCSQWLCSLFGIVSMYLNMTMKQHSFQYILIAAVIVNFVCNSLLIPRYGMTGAAASYGISTLFWYLCGTLLIYKKDNVLIFWNKGRG